MPNKFFIIAGEASGDHIGAKLMKALRAINPDAEIYGVGGQKMEAAGLKSLFSMKEISLFGFAEVVPHIFHVMGLIKKTVADINRIQPDAVITIDSPGFNFRVAKELQALRGSTKLIHYVAPTVWAYKEERAKKIAKIYNHLLVILPFEPPYFRQEGLATSYIGHPLTEDGIENGSNARFRNKYNFQDEFICVMAGSREGEIKRLLPILQEAADKTQRKFALVAAPYLKEKLIEATQNWANKPLIVDNEDKFDCFAASSGGIIKSGTSGLEYGFAKKPFVVFYKVNAISYFMIKSMIKTKFVNLINIIADKEIVPELIQNQATAENISAKLNEVLAKPSEQISQITEVLKELYSSHGTPSDNAVKKIVEICGGGS